MDKPATTATSSRLADDAELERMAKEAFADDQAWEVDEMWKDGDMRTFCARLVQLARQCTQSAKVTGETPRCDEALGSYDGPSAQLARQLERELTICRELFERECQDGDKIAAAAGVQRTDGGYLPVAKIINRFTPSASARSATVAPIGDKPEIAPARDTQSAMESKDAIIEECVKALEPANHPLLAAAVKALRALKGNASGASSATTSLIELHELHVWPPEKWKGDARRMWTVRKQDKNENTLAQARAETLGEAVAQCLALLQPAGERANG